MGSGYVPVPMSGTGTLATAPPFTFSASGVAPFVVGLNVTLIVQLAWLANDLP